MAAARDKTRPDDASSPGARMTRPEDASSPGARVTSPGEGRQPPPTPREPWRDAPSVRTTGGSGPVEARNAAGRALRVFASMGEARQAFEDLEDTGHPIPEDVKLVPRRAVALFHGPWLIDTFDDHQAAGAAALEQAKLHLTRARAFDGKLTLASILERFTTDPPAPLAARKGGAA